MKPLHHFPVRAIVRAIQRAPTDLVSILQIEATYRAGIRKSPDGVTKKVAFSDRRLPPSAGWTSPLVDEPIGALEK